MYFEVLSIISRTFTFTDSTTCVVNELKKLYSYVAYNEKIEQMVIRQKERIEKKNLKASKEKIKRLTQNTNRL